MKQIGKTKYFISKEGKVINSKTGRNLKPQNNGNGYMKVTLTINGIQIQKYVHRLVAEYYVNNPDNLKQVNHIDGNKSNNDYMNLEWCTHSYNQIHAHKIGLKKNGIDLWNGKFTKSDIEKIFSLDGKIKRYEIAEKMNCAKSTISDILNGKRYKYIVKRTN